MNHFIVGLKQLVDPWRGEKWLVAIGSMHRKAMMHVVLKAVKYENSRSRQRCEYCRVRLSSLWTMDVTRLEMLQGTMYVVIGPQSWAFYGRLFNGFSDECHCQRLDTGRVCRSGRC